eukprot:754230-Hanusia_phi.AAC.1
MTFSTFRSPLDDMGPNTFFRRTIVEDAILYLSSIPTFMSCLRPYSSLASFICLLLYSTFSTLSCHQISTTHVLISCTTQLISSTALEHSFLHSPSFHRPISSPPRLISSQNGPGDNLKHRLYELNPCDKIRRLVFCRSHEPCFSLSSGLRVG